MLNNFPEWNLSIYENLENSFKVLICFKTLSRFYQNQIKIENERDNKGSEGEHTFFKDFQIFPMKPIEVT